MKLNIRKKLVSLAVASAVTGGAMMAIPAQAMNVSQNNTGQVLLFPYYTVKNGFDTLFTVTNTSDYTAVIKVRWREALNSREVRDFNVILSPKDIWTGVVTSSDTGALVRTFDKTCTSPQLNAGPNGSTEVDFTNALFSGKFADGATADMERVRDGYFEVFLMGVSSRSTSNSDNTLEYNAKHVNGVPRDCAAVDDLFLSDSSVADLNNYMSAPMNVLKGHSTFINVATGKAIDTEPTAIENFRVFDGPYLSKPGDLDPDLSDGDAFGTAYRFIDGNLATFGYAPSVDPTVHGGSLQGVSDLLRASGVINEYTTGANAEGSWVITFPTKHFYTDAYSSSGSVSNGTVVFGGGFSDWFFTKNGSTVVDGKSCDNIDIFSYNREEGEKSSGTSFSPVVGDSDAICYEVNVLNFNGTNVFGSSGANHNNVNTVGSSGWMGVEFTESSATSVGGLPVIGFSATNRETGDATTNFGSGTAHSYLHPTVD
jgi:hypothetical protein